MLKFLVAYPFTRLEIAESGTMISENKIVKTMNSNLDNMLENDLLRFGFNMKKKVLSKDITGPGMSESPNSQ